MPRNHSKISAPYEAANRRQAAVHEAGHTVLWHAFGFDSQGYIWPREDDDWVGMVGPHDRDAWYDLGPVQRRMLGVAGAIAQQVWVTRYPTDFCTDDMSAGWEILVSPDDWRCGSLVFGNPEDPDPLWYRAATLVAKRFDPMRGGDLWPELYRCAHQLIVAARNLDSAAKEAKAIYDVRLKYDMARDEAQLYRDMVQRQSAESISPAKTP